MLSVNEHHPYDIPGGWSATLLQRGLRVATDAKGRVRALRQNYRTQGLIGPEAAETGLLGSFTNARQPMSSPALPVGERKIGDTEWVVFRAVQNGARSVAEESNQG